MEWPVQLIDQALQGDRAAIEALSAWCLRHAFRLAFVDLGSVPNRELLADEIAVAASLKAILRLHQFQSGTHFYAWLHQIVRNCLRDHYRERDCGLPPSLYQRWVHDFLYAYRPQMEALVQRELGEEPSAPHPMLIERIAADLREKSYREFMRLAYAEREDLVLDSVKQWLREFLGLEGQPLYHWSRGGEWIALEIAAEDTALAGAIQHDFIQEVNERLAELLPLCRRLLRWYYLNQLPLPDIARLEHISERTLYRRVASCSAAFRRRLVRDEYFAEFAHGNEPGAITGRRGHRFGRSAATAPSATVDQ